AISATAPAGATAGSTALASTVATAAPVASQTATQAAAATPGPGEFANPVIDQDFADPGALRVGDTYYAYATNFGSTNVQVARSKDLVHWEMLNDALPILPAWASPNNTWAPEVMALADGKSYVMYFTARDTTSNKQCVGVATGDKPEGPFKSTQNKPFVCQLDEGGTIDPSPFRDGNKQYLYFKNDGNCCNLTTYLYVQELAPDGLSLVGQPTRLVSNDKPWEGSVVEAPEMVKHDDKYYLLFSANNYAGVDYAVGYASCKSPTGPCQDAPENPILKSDLKDKPPVIGPGGESMTTFGSETWMLYHAWEVTAAGLGDRRLMWIDRVTWEDGKPHVHGPTEGPQKMP
ncbi:MAG TPA: glycoside hydrolase family 43 protein, partial [Herpetosiphonaceae bacterium]|nr:glycoside hydrolase family 43 protein [Herpetosiphonaceae bacterium]